MLFYTQIRREFTPTSWKRGQLYFREERVSEVRQDGNLVEGKVQGSIDDAYQTMIEVGRGTISNSKCSCPAHRVYETHCKHVAALAIWIVERGSLLRAGIKGGTQFGLAAVPQIHRVGRAGEERLVLLDAQKAAVDPRLRKLILSNPILAESSFIIRRDLNAGLIQGKSPDGSSFSIPITLQEADALFEQSRSETEVKGPPEAVAGVPILYVRGMFQSKVFTALTVESGIRYMDPQTKSVQISTLTYLSKQNEQGLWKTTQDLLVQVPSIEDIGEIGEEHANFIQRLDFTKVIYQGPAALDELAKLLDHKLKNEMVFDSSVHVEVAEDPLRIVSLDIGRKSEKNRKLGYVFEGAGVRFTSEDLDELSKFGRLSGSYVWKENKIYKFDTSLGELSRFSNRSGVATFEGESESQEKAADTGFGGFGALHDDTENPLHPISAFRLSLELGVKILKVDPEWHEFHEWRKNFEKTRIPSLPKIDYGFELREYQKNGLSWIWSLYHRGLAALLADDMGLGKTHQVLAFLSSIYQKSGRATQVKQPTLVVAPTSVISAWAQKLNKYDTGLKWYVFHGSRRTFPQSGVDLILTTYGILHREAVLREKNWHAVILDEAQAIKNAATISSRVSRALKSKYRIAMTGTPVENHSTDLWSLMEFLLPGYLGSLPRFKRLYGWGRETPPQKQAEALRRLVSPFLMRRTKSQVLTELPEKTEEVIQCGMTEVQKKAYRACLNGTEAKRARESLKGGGKIDYANILALLTRLKQICDHPKLPAITGSNAKKPKSINPADTGKWEAFTELLEEALGSNLKVVVFTQYLGMMDIIGRWLKSQKIGYTDLRGDTTDRGARIEKFSQDPECKVFLCSLLAGGLGIDLTAGSVCIHVDRWWNPAKENQATDRLHRFGQTRGVQIFKLQIPNTVEDRIAGIIQSKTELSGALIEESSVGLKAFSRKDLLSLLATLPE